MRALLITTLICALSACGLAAEMDTQEIGDGLLAEQVGSMIGCCSDEEASEKLTEWVAQQCMITDLDGAERCGSTLGMRCSRPSGGEVTCSYTGIGRMRFIERVLATNWLVSAEPWQRCVIRVDLRYADPGPVVVARSSICAEEVE